MQAEAMAGDHYRIEMRRGSVVSSLFSLKKKKTAAVVQIIDLKGAVVWERRVETIGEAKSLSALIHEQVFSARLTDFEHWLRTESRQA